MHFLLLLRILRCTDTVIVRAVVVESTTLSRMGSTGEGSVRAFARYWIRRDRRSHLARYFERRAMRTHEATYQETARCKTKSR